MTGEAPVKNKAAEGAPETAPPPKGGVSPLKALALSALILPGLGQILTGRKIRGAIMAVLLALWLPAAIIKVGLDLTRVMPELMMAGGQALSLADVQALMRPLAGSLVWLFLPLLTIWFWSLADSIIYYLRSQKDG